MAQTTATKSFRGFAIKDADKGEIEAVVATLGVVDRDGDIIRKGALGGSSSVTMSAWGHDAVFGVRPAGKGVLTESKGKLHFAGRAFLNTANGRETFEVLKEMGDDQEWSFGFYVTGTETPSDEERKAGAYRVITKMDAFEVSPVLVGAGINTQTTFVKAAAQADGDPAEPPVTPDAALIVAIAKEVTERIAAEAKAAKEAAAEAARVEAETKAAAEAAAEAKAIEDKRAEESAAARKEYETFQRTMRRVA